MRSSRWRAGARKGKRHTGIRRPYDRESRAWGRTRRRVLKGERVDLLAFVDTVLEAAHGKRKV